MKRFLKVVSIVMTVSTLILNSACSSVIAPQQSKVTLDIPQQWTAIDAADTMALQQSWLLAFNDPDLVAFVQRAMRNNVDIKSAIARVNIATNSLKISSSNRLPGLTTSLQASRSGTAFDTPAGFERSTASQFSGSFDINWEADVWGRLSHRVRAENFDYLAAKSDLQQAYFSLAANITKLWFDAVESQLQVKLAEKTLHSFQLSHDIIASGYRDGINQPLDVHLARSSLANAYSRLAAERIRLDAILRNLQTLTSKYPDASLLTTQILPELDATTPAGLPSELLARRPDIQAAMHRLSAADARSSEAQLNRLPVFSLTGSLGNSSSELKHLLNFDYLLWRIVTGITAPLFQGGRLQAGQQLAIAQADESLQRYTQTVLTALREVESGLYAEPQLKQQLSSLQQASISAHASEQLATEQYREGLVDIITLLETQRRSFDSQRALITLKNQRLQNRINLYLALGGTFLDQTDSEEKSL